MVRYGIIGTNFITEWFIEAGNTLDSFQLSAVYSRTKERAETFADKYGGAEVFTTIEEMAKSPLIDAVYIASPTSLHAEQAILCMKHGKHVLCEKPMASHHKEVEQMVRVAEENGVILMEAVKSTALPNFQKLKQAVSKVAPVRRMVTSYCQYSSRYDAFKEGTVLNAFNPQFSNGALMDIGLYCLYPIVDLFGKPDKVKASGIKLSSGVDGEGTVILTYPEMEAVAMYSKITNSSLPSEIQGEKGTIIINHIQKLSSLEIYYLDGSVENVTVSQDKPDMVYEIEVFHNKIHRLPGAGSVNSLDTSKLTSEVMTSARDQLQVCFPADHSRL
ncbi:Gfo/Idh/MocA family oxidoreductase [Salipaludibacillus sp. CUR1]|uniref:Gfo/Idh/MocA family protein n=1 Tax=Salipaludibacillus sp. CUR1 TaxID=2820003 RepID=UPI001E3B58DF|nr:Gfo/Idh/MocA family oxidoreductase [Salipaludibacillus sp. CUR1]MCE7793567.1 Gfo/Idh/MocA family oxidoreductase [Salipaludibacillus sp. CUR1]